MVAELLLSITAKADTDVLRVFSFKTAINSKSPAYDERRVNLGKLLFRENLNIYNPSALRKQRTVDGQIDTFQKAGVNRP